MKKLAFLLLIILAFTACKPKDKTPPPVDPTDDAPTVPTDPTDDGVVTPPPVDLPVLDWNINEIKNEDGLTIGHTILVIDVKTGDIVVQKNIDGITPIGSFSDLTPYVEVSLEKILLEDGTPVVPQACPEGSQVILTISSLKDPENFEPNMQKKAEVQFTLCRKEILEPTVIDSVTIRDVGRTSVGINLYASENVQAVTEFGLYNHPDSLIYSGIKENSFNYSEHRMAFGNKPGEELLPGRRYYFQAVATDEDGVEYRWKIMTVTTKR